MTDQEQREVFAKNLVDVLSEKNETQKDVADAMGVSPQVINTWCKAIALPRMGKVQRLATHLEVPVTRLLDRQISIGSDDMIHIDATHKEAEIMEKYRALEAFQRERIEERMDEMLEKKTSGMESDINVG